MRQLILVGIQYVQSAESAAVDWDVGGDGNGTFLSSELAGPSSDPVQATHKVANGLIRKGELTDWDRLLTAFASTSAMDVYRLDSDLSPGTVEKLSYDGTVESWTEIGNGDFVTVAYSDMGLVRSEDPRAGAETSTWRPGQNYEVGDVRHQDGTDYECLQDHFALTSYKPADSTSLWDPLSDGTTDEWQVGVAYEIDDVVLYNGTEYICIQAHTSQEGWEPPNVPSLWDPVS